MTCIIAALYETVNKQIQNPIHVANDSTHIIGLEPTTHLGPATFINGRPGRTAFVIINVANKYFDTVSDPRGVDGLRDDLFLIYDGHKFYTSPYFEDSGLLIAGFYTIGPPTYYCFGCIYDTNCNQVCYRGVVSNGSFIYLNKQSKNIITFSKLYNEDLGSHQDSFYRYIFIDHFYNDRTDSIKIYRLFSIPSDDPTYHGGEKLSDYFLHLDSLYGKM
jgi:hypothetical protein